MKKLLVYLEFRTIDSVKAGDPFIVNSKDELEKMLTEMVKLSGWPMNIVYKEQKHPNGQVMKREKELVDEIISIGYVVLGEYNKPEYNQKLMRFKTGMLEISELNDRHYKKKDFKKELKVYEQKQQAKTTSTKANV